MSFSLSRGFTLIEISIALALIGLIGAGLSSVIFAFNRTSAAMINEHTLLATGRNMIQHISQAAGRTGYYFSTVLRFDAPHGAGDIPLTSTPSDEVYFCFTHEGQNRGHGFRVRGRRLQQNITDSNNCTANSDWDNISDDTIDNIAFSVPAHNPRVLNVRIVLGTPPMTIVVHQRLPLYSLLTATVP